jgi:hypothetical protein
LLKEEGIGKLFGLHLVLPHRPKFGSDPSLWTCEWLDESLTFLCLDVITRHNLLEYQNHAAFIACFLLHSRRLPNTMIPHTNLSPSFEQFLRLRMSADGFFSAVPQVFDDFAHLLEDFRSSVALAFEHSIRLLFERAWP